MADQPPIRPTFPGRSAARASRRAVAPQDLVETSYLGDGMLPLVVRPRVGDIDLPAWAEANRERIAHDLLRHGGILFRAMPLRSVAEFELFTQAIAPHRLGYVEGSSPRIQLADGVYTSTEYPPEFAISLHSELSYAHRWPARILFFCETAPEKGGATPIADNRKLLAALPEPVLRRFRERGTCYLRNLHDGSGAGLSWQRVFETGDRAAVERYCREGEIEFTWRDDGGLRTRQLRPALIRHPQTADWVWFNQVDQWHTSNLEPEVARSLLATTPESELPICACYGDGSPLHADDLDAVRAAYRSVRVAFPWEKGDVLVLDNMLVAHGREPFAGARRVVVAMGEPVELAEVERVP